jgi:hypothetical protein
MLLQAVFERIWLIDDRIVGSDLTRPFAELLTVDAQLDARAAIAGSTESTLTYLRRETTTVHWRDLGAYLRVERPTGTLPVDEKNPRRVAEVEGSNFFPLVGVAVCGCRT